MYTFQEYQTAAARTAATANLTVRVLGLAGEAGETAELAANHLVFAALTLLNQASAAKVADLLKKVLGHGHELDKEKVKKELGDQLWYIAMTGEAIGFTMEDIAKANVAKLQARYPNGFDPERSKNRPPEDGQAQSGQG
jgi:NTP pyrophosphatase (non-canonical NTP hydrolase)